MLERLLIFAVVVGLVYLAYRVLKGRQLERITRQIEITPDPLLAEFKQGVPGVMLFTADFCAPCKTQQRPAIQRLLQQVGTDRLQVIEVDVQANPQAASLWGVLSLPTTYILDSKGQPKEVNYGVTSTEKLRKQLETVGLSGS